MIAKRKKIAVAAISGVLGLGGLMLASPAVASTLGYPSAVKMATLDHGSEQGEDGCGRGAGNRARTKEKRDQAKDAACEGTALLGAKGTLTDAQRSTVASLAQEEKLAHDLYVAFAKSYDAKIFDRIAVAENRHLQALRALMKRYDITDPTKDQPEGKFTDSAVQSTYDRLLAQGSGSQKAAVEVGKTVEQQDIKDLDKALEGLNAEDAKRVYTLLKKGSERHLKAFTRWVDR